MNHKEDTKRIAKNTIYLYIRSLIIMAVSLYTSRVVLAALGFENHGLYNLVGSVVAMFNMFSATFVSSTQRFLNIEIGKKNKERTRRIFSASLNIHFILALVILVLLETIGLWFLNDKLNIPEGREFAANFVYQISIVTFLINMISVPYNAVIVANERMSIFAIVSIYESVMKLLIVYLLACSPFDVLIFYSILIALVPFSIRLFYGFYCGRNFPECHYMRLKDKELYKEMLKISGWNFLGSSASVLTVTSIGAIINMFTNVIVNSAKGIAGQVENIIGQLFNNFTIALRPQITKSYASGDFEYLKDLVMRGTKMSFFLMCILCIPIMMLTDSILKLWLGNIPPYTVKFVQFCLFYLIQNAFSTILDILLLSTGKIKHSQIILSLLQLLNLPLSCLLLWLGYPPYYVYISFIVISYVSLGVRVFFVDRYTVLKYNWYIGKVLIPLIVACIFIYPITQIISQLSIENLFVNILVKGCLIEICFILIFYSICLNKQERITAKEYFRKIVKKYGTK